MARIRSIKPDFWRDEKIASLKNRNAALFFIGLWNFADDEGKFNLSAKALALQMPIFRSKDILTYIRDLSDSGLIQVSVCSGWGLVTNWHHQKIDRPIPPKVKAEEIQWHPIGYSSSPRDLSSIVRRKDRIGKDQDRIGSDQGVLPETELQSVVDLFTAKKRKLSASAKASPTGVQEVIAHYCDQWRVRYNLEDSPPVTPAAAGRFSELVKTVGKDRAKVLIDAYLAMPDSWFVTKRHDVFVLMSNLNSVSQFAESGKIISRAEISDLDKRISNNNTLFALNSGEV